MKIGVMSRILFAVLILAIWQRPAVSEMGYRYSLFDGQTLHGWTAENGAVATVQNGQILLKEGNGWLRSDHTYGDFKLHIEWKALKAEGYDAGIYLRAAREGKPFPKPAYQINLKDGQEGTLIGIPEGEAGGLVRRGDWNTFDITAQGQTATLEINGRPAYKAQGLANRRGHIGIQVEVPLGGQFLIRKIEVTELDHQPLLGTDKFTYWEGAGQPAESCWELKDGVLLGTKNKGPWLRSRKEYGDFNLRLEYQVDEGANSGVFVRVPANGNHHRKNENEPPAGFEVQILDDHARKYRNLKPYQFSGSVYDIAGADPRVTKQPGEWNTLEINCVGQKITTVHNGHVIIRVTPETHPLINLRSTRGFLGLQNHGGGVKFRNLRIGPAIEEEIP